MFSYIHFAITATASRVRQALQEPSQTAGNEKRIYAAGLTRPINRLSRVRMANAIVSWFQWLTHQYPP